MYNTAGDFRQITMKYREEITIAFELNIYCFVDVMDLFLAMYAQVSAGGLDSGLYLATCV